MKSMALKLLVFGLPVWALPALVLAAGFQLPEQGVAAMGQANAFVAQADNPSAVYYNPAGILQLEGTQATLGTTLLSTSSKFTNTSTTIAPSGLPQPLAPAGTETDGEDLFFVLPHVYVTHRLNDRWGLGLGVFTPFGLATEWPQDWEGRFISYNVELATYYFNPVVAFSPRPGLTFSAGLQYVYSTVELHRKLDLSLLGQPEGNLDLESGNGDGWGYNLAILARLNEANTVGAAFRSQVRVNYEGDAKFTVPPAVSPLFPDGTVRTDITMPPILEVGLTNRSVSNLTLSFDLQWVGWSSFSHLNLDFENEVFPTVLDSTVPKNWNDRIRFLAGAEYALSPSWDVRLGYVWDPTPVPPETVDTLLADNNRHDVSAGLGFRAGSLTVDLAYMAIIFPPRNVANVLPVTPTGTVYNQVGKYESIAHEGGVSVTYRF